MLFHDYGAVVSSQTFVYNLVTARKYTARIAPGWLEQSLTSSRCSGVTGDSVRSLLIFKLPSQGAAAIVVDF